MKRAIDFVVEIVVTLIVIGPDRWAAMLSSGTILLDSTSNPRPEVAQALLDQGFDPRSNLLIRAGASVLANDLLGVIAGGHVMSGDLGVMQLDA